MKNVLRLGVIAAFMGCAGAHAAERCTYQGASEPVTRAAFLDIAVADFCDVSAEDGSADGMFYDTELTCEGAAIPLHIEGAGGKIVASFGGLDPVSLPGCK